MKFYSKDQTDLNCILTPSIREVKVPVLLKSHLDGIVKAQNETFTSAFRKVAYSLIPNQQDWAIRNKISMYRDFDNKLTAAYG